MQRTLKCRCWMSTLKRRCEFARVLVRLHVRCTSIQRCSIDWSWSQNVCRLKSVCRRSRDTIWRHTPLKLPRTSRGSLGNACRDTVSWWKEPVTNIWLIGLSLARYAMRPRWELYGILNNYVGIFCFISTAAAPFHARWWQHISQRCGYYPGHWVVIMPQWPPDSQWTRVLKICQISGCNFAPTRPGWTTKRRTEIQNARTVQNVPGKSASDWKRNSAWNSAQCMTFSSGTHNTKCVVRGTICKWSLFRL